LALNNALGGVEPEHPGSNFSHDRQWLNDWSVQFEVLVPYVAPGIEKSDRFARAIDGWENVEEINKWDLTRMAS
jgi:hypothetical protein